MHGLRLKLWRCPGADPSHLRLELVMCKSGELQTTPLNSCFGCRIIVAIAGSFQTRVDLLPVPWFRKPPQHFGEISRALEGLCLGRKLERLPMAVESA